MPCGTLSQLLPFRFVAAMRTPEGITIPERRALEKHINHQKFHAKRLDHLSNGLRKSGNFLD